MGGGREVLHKLFHGEVREKLGKLIKSNPFANLNPLSKNSEYAPAVSDLHFMV